MSDKNENRILVLQNVTLKANCKKNVLYKKPDNSRNGLDSEIEGDSVMNLSERRRTASSYIFDEEPIFSDTDEETEYCKNLLATIKCPNSTNKTHKIDEIEIQHNLSSDECKIMDVIKECASINTENVNDDFTQLISSCRELQNKYNKYIPLTTTEELSSETVTSSSIHEDISNYKSQISMNLANCQQFIPASTFQDRFCHDKLFPSRRGSSDTQNTFFSQIFSVDSGFSSSCTTESLDLNKENIVRRSDRIRRPVNRNFLGKFITGKDRKELLNKMKNKRNNKRQNKKVLTEPMKPKKTVKQLKSLGRNWMKTNNGVVKGDKLPDNNESVSSRQRKFRRLYSPSEWLQSPEIVNLYTD